MFQSQIGASTNTPDISALAEIIKFISDNGIMIVISAVVIYFLARVLNSMLNQNAQFVSQLSPKMDDLHEAINNLAIKRNDADNRQILAINKQFAELQDIEKDMSSRIKSMSKELSVLRKTVSDLEDEIEKQHVYIDFYQEQLKKEKGQ